MADKFFDATFYINLDERPDRKEKIIEEMNRLDLCVKYQRIPGVIYNGEYDSDIALSPDQIKHFNGIMGCMLSHLSILHWALKHSATILIFEDDAKLINDFDTIIKGALLELPKNWDMLYLGGNICNTVEQISPHLGRLSHSQSTHAYAVNKNFVGKLIEYIDPYNAVPLDLIYAYKVIPENNCYITVPMVAVQRASFSDIENAYVEYESWMEDRFYKNLKRIIT